MYIQMEFCDNQTLRSAIDKDLYKDTKRLWKMFREIIEGLLHIHSQGRKYFWKIIRHFVKENDAPANLPPFQFQSNTYTTSEEKANCLNNYFSSISSVDDSKACLPQLILKTENKLPASMLVIS